MYICRPASHNANYAIIAGYAENARFLHDYALFGCLLFSPPIWPNALNITIFRFLPDLYRKITCFEASPDLMKTLVLLSFPKFPKLKKRKKRPALWCVFSRSEAFLMFSGCLAVLQDLAAMPAAFRCPAELFQAFSCSHVLRLILSQICRAFRCTFSGSPEDPMRCGPQAAVWPHFSAQAGFLIIHEHFTGPAPSLIACRALWWSCSTSCRFSAGSR